MKCVAAGCLWCPKFREVENGTGEAYEEKKTFHHTETSSDWELIWVCQLLNDIVKGIITVGFFHGFSTQTDLGPCFWRQFAGVHMLVEPPRLSNLISMLWFGVGFFYFFFYFYFFFVKYLEFQVLGRSCVLFCVWHRWCCGFFFFWMFWQTDAWKRHDMMRHIVLDMLSSWNSLSQP